MHNLTRLERHPMPAPLRLRPCLLAAALAWPALSSGEVLRVLDFLPQNPVTDGSVSYQAEVQKAIDEAASRGAILEFPAMKLIVRETGWRLHTGMTLTMHGTVFDLSVECAGDGAVFHGDGVSNLTLTGGEIVGRNEIWGDGINIRGIRITGDSSNIRIRDMRFRDLSSNGIGLFGSAGAPIREVWVEDVVVENCCKRYPDYLSKEKAEKGSVREDQGDVAFYYVENFVVRGCRFEGSRSDGTHFYQCRNGHITDNWIFRAKMGGYFLETCENITGSGNIVLENGSRGVTIERGCIQCVFSGNVVRLSGREGLWAPDCVGLLVSGNIFDRNGRKPNGPEPRFIWNANITVNEAHGDPSNSPTQDYLIVNNQIHTTGSQIAAIRVDATETTRNILISGNQLLGENTQILVEGSNASQVTLR